jgi:hypothetical protein
MQTSTLRALLFYSIKKRPHADDGTWSIAAFSAVNRIQARWLQEMMQDYFDETRRIASICSSHDPEAACTDVSSLSRFPNSAPAWAGSENLQNPQGSAGWGGPELGSDPPNPA